MDHFIVIKKLLKFKINTKYKAKIVVEAGYGPTDEAELKKEPGLYKGFPLLDPNWEVVPDPDNDNKLEVKIKDPHEIVRYTKEKIDDFRTPGTGYTGDYHDIFTKTRLSRTRNKEGVEVETEVYENRDPKDCLGF